MGLFDRIASAVSDPNLQANAGQIGNIVSALQQTSSQKSVDPSTLQTVMSVVGKYARGSLQQKRNQAGEESAREVVNQFGGTSASEAAVRALFSPTEEEQVAENAARQTGIDANTVRSLLPVVVPLVLNFLKTGADNRDPQQGNPVLSNFLDADGDGDVDMGDALNMASQYLQR